MLTRKATHDLSRRRPLLTSWRLSDRGRLRYPVGPWDFESEKSFLQSLP